MPEHDADQVQVIWEDLMDKVEWYEENRGETLHFSAKENSFRLSNHLHTLHEPAGDSKLVFTVTRTTCECGRDPICEHRLFLRLKVHQETVNEQKMMADIKRHINKYYPAMSPGKISRRHDLGRKAPHRDSKKNPTHAPLSPSRKPLYGPKRKRGATERGRGRGRGMSGTQASSQASGQSEEEWENIESEDNIGERRRTGRKRMRVASSSAESDALDAVSRYVSNLAPIMETGDSYEEMEELVIEDTSDITRARRALTFDDAETTQFPQHETQQWRRLQKIRNTQFPNTRRNRGHGCRRSETSIG